MVSSDSNSSNDADDDPAKVARRQRAMEILARVLKPNGGGGATANGSVTSAEEEQRFLQSLLGLKSRDEIARGYNCTDIRQRI